MYDILIISLELFETKTFGKFMRALETAVLAHCKVWFGKRVCMHVLFAAIL